MSATDDLLGNAARYADGFAHADLERSPAKGVAIVACMDTRLSVHRLFGLQEGDAHVIRNAGGVITDAELRALAISQWKMGTTEIVLVHHTDCGLHGFSDGEFAAQLEEATGLRPTWPTVAFDDVEGDVRESIARIKRCPFIPHKESVRGFVYDVKTGRLTEVV